LLCALGSELPVSDGYAAVVEKKLKHHVAARRGRWRWKKEYTESCALDRSLRQLPAILWDGGAGNHLESLRVGCTGSGDNLIEGARWV
jgi:hypothetical protein